MAKWDQGSFSSAGTRQPAEPEAIARRAYELYQQRGGEAGHEIEDWLQAEAELTARAEGANSDDLPDRLDGVSETRSFSPPEAVPPPRKGNGGRRPQARSH